MNAERLIEHYERIADAPDAIAHLRRFILDLAVRGKLVPGPERRTGVGTAKARRGGEGAAGEGVRFDSRWRPPSASKGRKRHPVLGHRKRP
jgi:type I restriction enzyme, S subunit